MTKHKDKRSRNRQAADSCATGGATPAVPPPDDPLRRNESTHADVDSVEAAALRAEAMRRLRQMPSDDKPPPGKD